MAKADTNEVFRRTFSYCSFMNPKGLNFMAQFFISFLQKKMNPDILKCPFKKGVYLACEHADRMKFGDLQLPPFMQLGQNFDVTIAIKSIINKRNELLCSVFLHYVVASS